MNPFKKYCISFVILSALCLMVIHPVLFYASLGVEDAPGRTIDNWFRIKEAHANSASGRKLFVLSCSTALYAADTSMMERELGITSVNFATTISLRKYMFDRIRTSLRSGDIVLMPLEYHLYKDRPLEDEIYVYILEYDPEYFGRLPFSEKINCVYGVKTSFLLKRIIARSIRNEYGDDGSSFLISKHLNVNGDLTSNTYETMRYREPTVTPQQCFTNDDVPGKEMGRSISEFVEYCRKSNIKLYATWPPLYPVTGKKDFYGHDAEVARNIKAFWEANGVAVLGDYRDAFFEAEDCYNEASHLNDRAKPRYTRHLIDLIKPYI
ncbi:MAG: hypothetical protein IJS28_07900 [Synergistaceae bacterium]|nr:hypothetical protein [Synergistaceae bacterium]